MAGLLAPPRAPGGSLRSGRLAAPPVAVDLIVRREIAGGAFVAAR